MNISSLIGTAALMTLMAIGCSSDNKKKWEKNIQNKKPQPFSVKGSYVSGCIDGTLGGKRVVSVLEEGNLFTINTERFNDELCENSIENESLSGRLEVVQNLESATLVKLVIPISENASTWRFYKMKLLDTTLLMSDFFMQEDQAANYELSNELFKNEIPSDEVPAEDEKQSAKKSFNLRSGDYEMTSGSVDLCGQNIGVGKNRETGIITSLIVTFLAPCTDNTAFLVCDHNGVCTGKGIKITILSDTSYELELLADGNTAIFEKY